MNASRYVWHTHTHIICHDTLENSKTEHANCSNIRNILTHTLTHTQTIHHRHLSSSSYGNYLFRPFYFLCFVPTVNHKRFICISNVLRHVNLQLTVHSSAALCVSFNIYISSCRRAYEAYFSVIICRFVRVCMGVSASVIMSLLEYDIVKVDDDWMNKSHTDTRIHAPNHADTRIVILYTTMQSMNVSLSALISYL